MKTALLAAALCAFAFSPAQALDAAAIADMDQTIAGIRGQIPLQMATNMWLIDIHRSGDRLFYVMKVIGKAPATQQWKENYIATVCTKEWAALEEGWKYSDTLVDQNGSILAMVWLDKDMCP